MAELPQEVAAPSCVLQYAEQILLDRPYAPRSGQRTPPDRTMTGLVASAQRLADELAARANHGSTEAPRAELKRLAELGLLDAPIPSAYGGLGLGTEPGGHLPLLRVLAAIGGGDLALGRLYEGHVNALILIAAYGQPEQIERAAVDARAGKLFGVWNTGGREPMRLEARQPVRPETSPAEFTLRGVKTFATGAAFVDRPVVTAEHPGGGWQMTVPRLESPAVAAAVTLDRSFWRPLGMESSESYGIDFTGAVLRADDLVGQPGDFYRDPLFRGGAIRFAAVQAGAVLRLHRMLAAWLEKGGRGDDPYQLARLGEVTLGAQEAVLWIERAATVAEQGMSAEADKLATERMLECANMTRLAIERIATAMMPRVIAGVGAHGLLQPSWFERILRDLTMYLRQPAPDQTLAEVGRASIRKSTLRADGAANGMWLRKEPEGSLPPSYFHHIYAQSDDPWEFESSAYEAEKYRSTLASLPREHYARGLEVGCSIGVLTEKLAARCDDLLSVDVSERALERARRRCAALPQVRFECMEVPRSVPEGRFDLILVSEVAYYWTRPVLEHAMDLLAERQSAGGHLVLVHFTPFVPDYPQTGDEVHDAWSARQEWDVFKQERHERYRITVLERRG
jgi:alkylation response protein AidB-like acyl-CoA dehydrogenase